MPDELKTTQPDTVSASSKQQPQDIYTAIADLATELTDYGANITPEAKKLLARKGIARLEAAYNAADAEENGQQPEKLVPMQSTTFKPDGSINYCHDGVINQAEFVADFTGRYKIYRAGSLLYNADGYAIKKADLKKEIFQQISLDPLLDKNIQRISKDLAEAVIDNAPQRKAAKLKPITMPELFKKDIKPAIFLVKNFMPAGLCFLAAAPKMGKSFLCLMLGEAVATGKPFWGMPTTQGEVLYLALEDTDRRIKERSIKIGISIPDALEILTIDENKGGMVETLDQSLIDQLEEWRQDHKNPRLIIIDTLARVKGAAPRGFNSYEADSKQFAPLQEYALGHDLTILLVTHTKKTDGRDSEDNFDRVTGSKGLTSIADAMYLITGKRDAEQKQFHISGRDVEQNVYAVVCQDGIWQKRGTLEEEEQQQTENKYNTHPLVQTIRAMLRENNGRWQAAGAEIREEVRNRTEKIPCSTDKALRNELRRLEEKLLQADGIIMHKADGGRAGHDYSFEYVKR